MKIHNILSTLVFNVLFLILSFPVESDESSNIKIWLDTTSVQESIKTNTESYFNREFRYLGDIDLVEPDSTDLFVELEHDYYLVIDAKELKTKGGDVFCYTMTIIITKPFFKDEASNFSILENHYISKFSSKETDDSKPDSTFSFRDFRRMLNNSVSLFPLISIRDKHIYQFHFTYIDDDLKELVKDTVSLLDTTIFKTTREHMENK